MRFPLPQLVPLVLAISVLLPDTAQAQGTLTNGQNHPGSISTPGEIDTWTFTANQNDNITVSIGELPDPGDTAYEPWIRILGPTGAQYASSSGGVAAHAYIGAPLSGTYTVLVGSNDFRQDDTGSYQLTLAKVPGAFSISAGDEGGTLLNGQNHTGTIHRGDVDMWSFSAAQGDNITVSIGDTTPGEIDTGFSPWVRLIGPTGVEYASGSGGLAGHAYQAAPLSGTYVVLVASSDFNRDGYGTYRLTLSKAPGAFSISTGDDGGTLLNGENHDGSIDRGDVDMWSFTAALGDNITVSIADTTPGEIDTDFSPWVRLIGPTGVEYASGSGGLAGHAYEGAPLSGTYVVLVASSDFNRDGYGTYRLTLSKAPGAFSISAGDDGGTLLNGENHDGVITRGDVDMWSFTAAQGDNITVSIGDTTPGEIDTDFSPWVRLIGPTGVEYASGSGGLAGHAYEGAPLSGTYVVLVASSDFNRDGYGTYRLTLSKAPGAFSVSAGDEGGAMVSATSYTGVVGTTGTRPGLLPGDVDLWTIHANQGAAIAVTIGEITTSQIDPGFFPWIRLIGPTGAELRSDSGDRSAQINMTPAPLSGTYTILVASNDFGRDAVGNYVLQAVVTGGQSGTVPLAVGDTYTTAFNTPLTVSAPGVLANDTLATSAALASNVTSGSLSFSPTGAFTYTPAAGFSGQTSFTYRPVNSAGNGNVTTVTITVDSLPGTPVAVADGYDAQAGVTLTVSAPGVLGNDTGAGPLSATLTGNVSRGSLTLGPNGSFAYTATAGFSGQDSFRYRVSNANGAGTEATVSLNVTSAPIPPQPPTALRVDSVSGNQVVLRWNPPTSGPPPVGYIVEGGVSPGQVLASLPTSSALPIFTFSAPTGAFYVRVHTVIAGGARSAASNEVPLFTALVGPSAPAGLTSLVNGSNLTLSWRNTFAGGAPSGLVLDVRGTYNLSIPLGLAETFSFGGVPAGSYTLSLRATNAAGISASSNAVTVGFPLPCSGTPQPPLNFLAYTSGNTIFVLWDPPSTGFAPTAYRVNVTGAFSGSFTVPGRTISGAVPSGSYSLNVQAVNPCGVSAPVATQTVIVP